MSKDTIVLSTEDLQYMLHYVGMHRPDAHDRLVKRIKNNNPTLFKNGELLSIAEEQNNERVRAARNFAKMYREAARRVHKPVFIRFMSSTQIYILGTVKGVRANKAQHKIEYSVDVEFNDDADARIYGFVRDKFVSFEDPRPQGGLVVSNLLEEVKSTYRVTSESSAVWYDLRDVYNPHRVLSENLVSKGFSLP